MVVVDDDANADIVDRHLAGSGIGVERSATGLSLLNGTAASLKADLVIIDTGEGEASGLALGRRLKSNPHTVAIPLIVIGKSAQDRRECFEIGVDAYLTPDVLRDDFLLRLKGLLRVSDMRRSLIASQLEAEVKRRKEVGETFRRYVSPALVDQILADARLRDFALANKSTRVNATALFADMRGFTSIAEQLPPADVVPLLNEYFKLLTDIVFQFEGTVFNMAGDCLMVGFGVPFEQSDASVRAFRAAKEMLAQFDELVTRWKGEFGIEAGLGIGINAGEVIAGNIGSPDYMNYTIIGDAVNVAARLGQRARAGELLFPENVKRSLDTAGLHSDAVLLSPITLRGRTEPVEIFCVPAQTRFDLR
jgi:adenylate cyclase